MAQINNNDLTIEDEEKEEEIDEEDIINNFKNFYDLNPENIVINNPYNYNLALENLKKLTQEDFTNNLNEIIQREVFFDYSPNKHNKNFSINNILFLTKKSYPSPWLHVILNWFGSFLKSIFLNLS